VSDQSSVVADSRTYLEHRLSLAKFKRVEPACVRAGLAYVDAAGGVQCDEGVLVDKGKIVVRSFEIAYSRKVDGPWAWTYERFALYRCKGLFDPWIARSTPSRDVTGEESPKVC